MIAPLMIYLANLCDDINLILGIILVFLCLLLILVIVIYNSENVEEKKVSSCMKSISIWASIIALILVLFPSTKTVYQMMIIPTITNSQVVQKLPDEIQKYIDKTIGEK